MRLEHTEPENGVLRRIERATEIPMLILAVVFVVVFVVGYLPDVSPTVARIASFIELLIVAAFGAELVVKVAVAKRRWAYVRAHWLDVLIVLVPFLRPFRFLRFLPPLFRATYGLRRILGRYHGLNALTIGLLSVLASAALVARFEREAGGSIQDFGDALWWAAATVTTVGYGDATPVTPEGRAIAVFLMVVGITLFGILTASVAAYFIERAGHDQGDGPTRELLERITAIEDQLREQNDLLRRLPDTFTAGTTELLPGSEPPRPAGRRRPDRAFAENGE
jgi:voltage-gated potassium channel